MADSTTAIERLTRELVDIGGPLATLVHHTQMRAAATGRTSQEVGDVLADLIEPTIEGLADGWPEERILDAAAVLHAACERICSEIMIVVPPPNRAQRRGRRLR